MYGKNGQYLTTLDLDDESLRILRESNPIFL